MQQHAGSRPVERRVSRPSGCDSSNVLQPFRPCSNEHTDHQEDDNGAKECVQECRADRLCEVWQSPNDRDQNDDNSYSGDDCAFEKEPSIVLSRGRKEEVAARFVVARDALSKFRR
jgi:hypothetical protein